MARFATKDERHQAKADKQAEREQEKAEKAAEKERLRFEASPIGQARASYARGDQVFQCSIDVMSQQATTIPMMGATASHKTFSPLETLNAVVAEGWDIVSGSFVFVEQGQQSRDKFLASGQDVAIKGRTVGYYLFRRR